MELKSPLVAIRSLISHHHAENIEPNILSVTWLLGKRCNYDCSYCPPSVHDWVSEHLSIDTVKNFIRQLDIHCQSVGKTFKINLSGGEPFVHPKIIEILKIIRESPSCDKMLVAITNGSLPLDLYIESMEWISNLTVSLHLERSDDEILEKLEKIRYLNQISDRWINVQLMCLPGKFDFIQNYIEPFFVKNQIKYVLRKIRPMPEIRVDSSNQDVVEKIKEKKRRELLKTEFPLEFKGRYKKIGKKLLDDQLDSLYDEESYYTNQELEYLQKTQPLVFWENIGVWNQNLEYSTTNSDILASSRLNSFNGWSCFVGIDSIAVEIDGTVYRGICGNKGEIGSIFGDIKFPKEPTICERNWCVSNPDQTTRKSLPQYLHLITNAKTPLT